MKQLLNNYLNYFKELIMGRPRKNPLPLTTLETESTVEEQTLNIIEQEPHSLDLHKEPKLIELKNTALSIVRNPVTQHWMLVQFKFDYVTKTVGELIVLEEHTDRIEIVERFKMVAGTELMSAV